MTTCTADGGRNARFHVETVALLFLRWLTSAARGLAAEEPEWKQRIFLKLFTINIYHNSCRNTVSKLHSGKLGMTTDWATSPGSPMGIWEVIFHAILMEKKLLFTWNSTLPPRFCVQVIRNPGRSEALKAAWKLAALLYGSIGFSV